MGKFYVTTAIAYVNASPHVGFALEVIQADALARFHRLMRDEVFYLTGVDEHGVKIYETAKEAGMDTQDFTDMNAEKFQNLKGVLNLSNDDFIRTTSERHKKGAQKFWLKMVEKGDIYKSKYKGNYCVGCEAFILDKDLDREGNCPIHHKKPIVLEEENYFFKLSKYSDQVRKLIESDELKVVPASRKKEMLNLIGEEGLADVSFSRPKKVLPWGISVPNDPDQVMYVWCDALTNYITAIDYEHEGEQFKKFWSCDLHIIGKDILRFHAGVWIGMLLSAEVAIPKAIHVHGFVTSDGQKMSKSIGNVVDPLEYVSKYGVDSLRYFLLREIPSSDDGDFTHKRFLEVYNSELANAMGNLVNRVVMMTERYLQSKVPKVEDKEFTGKVEGIVSAYKEAFLNLDIKLACEKIVELVDFGNKYIDEKKPWVLAKEDISKVVPVLGNLLHLVSWLAIMLSPIVPETAEKIKKQFEGFNADADLQSEELLKEGSLVKKADVLFPRIEEQS